MSEGKDGRQMMRLDRDEAGKAARDFVRQVRENQGNDDFVRLGGPIESSDGEVIGFWRTQFTPDHPERINIRISRFSSNRHTAYR